MDSAECPQQPWHLGHHSFNRIFFRHYSSPFFCIAPATKYLNVVIPAKAGIQAGTGCRIKSGMTGLACLIAGLIRAFNI